jgi:hypothetical protein
MRKSDEATAKEAKKKETSRVVCEFCNLAIKIRKLLKSLPRIPAWMFYTTKKDKERKRESQVKAQRERGRQTSATG